MFKNFDLIIPRSRAGVGDKPVPVLSLTWWLWALFGNDRDGIYGEKPPRDSVPGYGQGYPEDERRFWRWWRRNPFHNLMWHVLRRRVTRPFYVVGWSASFEDEVNNVFTLRFWPFFLLAGWFFVGWRADKPHAATTGGGGAFDVGCKDIGHVAKPTWRMILATIAGVVLFFGALATIAYGIWEAIEWGAG